LRPGVRGISSRIRVRSVVGRFLEHSRVFAFGNGGSTEVYLGSADWMQRNIYERVEVMFRLKDPVLCSQVFTQVISPYLADTEKTRILMPSGDYVSSHKAGEFSASRNGFRFNAQEFLIGFPEVHDGAQAVPPLPRFVKLPSPRGAAGKSPRTSADAESSRLR
jgi:polyphosphate kinase